MLISLQSNSCNPTPESRLLQSDSFKQTPAISYSFLAIVQNILKWLPSYHFGKNLNFKLCTTNIQNIWHNDGHKCYILAPSQGIFYMHQVPRVLDNSYQLRTKSARSFLRYHNKHIKFKKNIATITQIWHRTKCYFTCISNI